MSHCTNNKTNYSKNKTASLESTQEWFEAFAKTAPYQHKSVDLSLLSNREIQALEILCRGNTLREAAKEMLSAKGVPLSRFTVGDYEIAIHTKLHVKNRTEMVKAALAAGVIKPIEGSDLTTLIQKYATLSKREPEIFELIATGKTAEEVSKDLCMSVHTGRVHKKKIYSKLGINNIADTTRSYVSLKLEADRLIAAKQATLEMETPVVVETPQPSPEMADHFAPTPVVHSVTRDLPPLSAVGLAAARRSYDEELVVGRPDSQAARLLEGRYYRSGELTSF